MRLLLDENISSTLAQGLAEIFPGSKHVDDAGLHGASDADIWKFAGEHAFVLVSKDNDFRQMSFLLGAPPKVVWLRVGNATTPEIEDLLLAQRKRIQEFVDDSESALLVLER